MVDVILDYESYVLFEVIHEAADKVRGTATAGIAVGPLEVAADVI